MTIRKVFSSVFFSSLMLIAAMPARAGIPVIDASVLVQQIQQVLSWANQASQMINQLNQMQTMTTKLDGVRNLGTILNNPTIASALPSDIRNANQLLINPSANVTSAANINQILASYGVSTSGTPPVSAQSAADTLGRIQQILASTQARTTQLSQLASRVDGTADAKDSMDMVNRNMLETASINNQNTQAMASLEAARQSAELKRIADDQAYFANVRAGGATALRTFTY